MSDILRDTIFGWTVSRYLKVHVGFSLNKDVCWALLL